MIKLAITGGIGSGKSYVASIFEKHNIPVYNADIESKRLTDTNDELRKKLIEIVGEECYDGTRLNRKFLAAYIFSSKEHLQQINSIIHPAVYNDYIRWIQRNSQHEITIMESAILYESGFDKFVDKVISVYAPLEIRIERVKQRDNAPEKEIISRINSQMNDDEKCSRADFVIINDGIKPVNSQVNDIINKLKS